MFVRSKEATMMRPVVLTDSTLLMHLELRRGVATCRDRHRAVYVW